MDHETGDRGQQGWVMDKGGYRPLVSNSWRRNPESVKPTLAFWLDRNHLEQGGICGPIKLHARSVRASASYVLFDWLPPSPLGHVLSLRVPGVVIADSPASTE